MSLLSSQSVFLVHELVRVILSSYYKYEDLFTTFLCWRFTFRGFTTRRFTFRGFTTRRLTFRRLTTRRLLLSASVASYITSLSRTTLLLSASTARNITRFSFCTRRFSTTTGFTVEFLTPFALFTHRRMTICIWIIDPFPYILKVSAH